MKKPNNPDNVNQFTKALTYLLIYLIGIYPISIAAANPIISNDNRTQINVIDDVPVIDIAAPNIRGISHNVYKEFNVEEQGAVLNNSIDAAVSEILGDVDKNPNFQDRSADLIINEVVGGNQSQLKGPLEVAGDRASVIISNPNGITVNGGGFLNMSVATLTTGKPTLNNEGFLDNLRITKGQINIEGDGLDGSFDTVDSIDIISRTLNLSGRINGQGNNINTIQGTNQINYGGLGNNYLTANIKGEGSSPKLAIDTSDLGGMYANKINILSTEKGVGVNLYNLKTYGSDIKSNGGDISINVNGNVTLANLSENSRDISANSDLNIGADNIFIKGKANVTAGKDIVLVSKNKIENNTRISGGKDIWLLGNNIINFDDSLISAKDNLWIQKTLYGDKSDSIKNFGGNINSLNGDIILRATRLENNGIENGKFFDQRITSGNSLYINANNINNSANITAKNDLILTGQNLNHQYISDFHYGSGRKYDITPQLTAGNKLLLDFTNSINVNSSLFNNLSFKIDNQKFYSPTFEGGSDSDSIKGKDIVLNANNINLHGRITANDTLKIIANDSVKGIKTDLNAKNEVSIIAGNNIDLRRLKLRGDSQNLLSKDGDVKIYGISDSDANDKHNNNKRLKKDGDVFIPFDFDTFPILGSIIRADKDLTISAGRDVVLENTAVFSSTDNGNTVTIFAGRDINVENNDKELRTFTIRPAHNKIAEDFVGGPFSFRSYINASNVSMVAGNNLALRGVQINCLGGSINGCNGNNVSVKDSDSVSLTAGKDILFSLKTRNSSSSGLIYGDDRLTSIGNDTSFGDIMFSVKVMAQGPRIIPNTPDDLHYTIVNLGPEFGANSHEILDLTTAINSGNVTLNAGGSAILKAADIKSKENTTILAGEYIGFDRYNYGKLSPDLNYFLTDNLVTSIKTGKNLNLIANDHVVTSGSKLISGENLSILSGGDIRLRALPKEKYTRSNDSYEYQTIESTELSAKGLLTLSAEGNILFQATKLAVEGLKNISSVISDTTLRNAIASGTMDISAKGGYIYAQALNETTQYETESVKRNWLGGKKTFKKIHQTSTPVVTEFSAPTGYINILGRDDVTFEGSKIEAGKNTNLTSLQGKVNFKAVSSLDFEQELSMSKGFYIKQRNKGYQENIWYLPQINIGGTLTVNATGINADIKTKDNQNLQDAIDLLSDGYGMSWIKDISKRNDVEWNKIQDAYSEWNINNKNLNPVVGAVIAVVVAVVTAGYAAPYAASIAGSSAAAQGAITAGMAAAASKAAVSLAENEGNLSKTFKDMGSSSTIKSIVTSAAIGGALAGFDSAMGWGEGTKGGAAINRGSMPLLSNQDWVATAQRVAGQSLISSGINTTINGGSFKDNFVSALLSNSTSQLHAEGAFQIGEYANQLTEVGRALSHAALSAIIAEVGGNDGKAAAAGALAASLAADSLRNTFDDSRATQIGGKIVGALAGAAITGTPEGVYAGANAGELTIIYNHDAHTMGLFVNKGKPGSIFPEGSLQDAVDACLVDATLCNFIVEFSPLSVLKDVKDAETGTDYIIAAASAAPWAKLGKAADKSVEAIKTLAKNGKFAEATRIYNDSLRSMGKFFKGNHRVNDLSKLKDKNLEPSMLRGEIDGFLKSKYKKDGTDPKPYSISGASVTVDGKKEYYLSVSGDAWSGTSPNVVNIKGVEYKVIRIDTNSIPSVTNKKQTNFNHAEQKLFNHFEDNFKGKKVDINMSIQNTSIKAPGMCTGCKPNSKVFADQNKDFIINIFEGTTGRKP
ncbi:DUF637 domain-containing protein [Xenorhabdus bovienii]|uniref:DUF637 domain-containing protein n=1 Tax=Xenorhabdus bovienii TaxID=40576 RepID=UPI00237D22A7|nr:DUF637 domain-containing protein [Xenorhabdus bovienii]MDE1496676.1 DUF637 domain-containing protein [Xenorhabdus bovienii]MDE9474293.1 DUF637 domain-containing protein [Xenorhabdus bovienii]